MDKCIFCGSVDIKVTEIPKDEKNRVECPLCTCYIISKDAIDDRIIDNIPRYDRILFSAYLRESVSNRDPLNLLSGDIIKISQIVAPYKKLTAIDKVNKVICYVAESSPCIGGQVSFDIEKDYTRFYCINFTELRQILDYLCEKGIIKKEEKYRGVFLTIEGWEKYERLKDINLNSKKVFVAMSFSDNLKDLFEKAIEPACAECNLNAIKIDLVEHNEKICDKIISEIKNSRLLIADFTEQRQNVYFEAGFALGLGIKVIWTCKEEDKSNLQFDTRQYKHIFWKDYKDLRIQLVNRIKATVL